MSAGLADSPHGSDQKRLPAASSGFAQLAAQSGKKPAATLQKDR